MSRNAIACGFLMVDKVTARYRVAADDGLSLKLPSLRERLSNRRIFTQRREARKEPDRRNLAGFAPLRELHFRRTAGLRVVAFETCILCSFQALRDSRCSFG
jgi:hypothetical protein